MNKFLFTVMAFVLMVQMSYAQKVANYQDDYKVGNNTNDDSPWKYYWNAPTGWEGAGVTGDLATGTIVDESSYMLMKVAGGMLTADGNTAGGDSTPDSFVRLTAVGGHPGGTGANYSLDRYAIASYTIQTAGEYEIESSAISHAKYDGNGIRVMVRISGDVEKFHKVLCRDAAGNFDTNLGTLNAGDKVYVAIGADGDPGFDGFTMNYNISKVNNKPIANAGTTQSIEEGELVTLDGSASNDPEGENVTYQWTAPNGITLSDATVAKPTFTAPSVDANTNYTLSLVVNDGHKDSDASTVIITVTDNPSPVANAGTAQSIEEGSVVTLDGSASADPEDEAITYQWTAPNGITLSDATVAKPTFTAPEVTADTDYTLSLVVNDGKSNSEASNVIITVTNDDKPVANAGTNQLKESNTLVTLDGSASSDPEGRAITYLWTAPNGITLSDATAQQPTFTAPVVTADTDYTFSLVVNDGKSDSDPVNVVVSVTSKPVANAGTNQSVKEGDLITLDGSASSSTAGPIASYQWTAPEGITLSDATVAMPTFTAPDVTEATDYTFSLVVNDGSRDSDASDVVISVAINQQPTANAGTAQLVLKGDLVTLDASASNDPEGETLIYQWTTADGITLSDATVAMPTFTAPDVTENTDYTFSLVINDGYSSSEASEVTVTVTGNPIANAGTAQSVKEGDMVTLDASASKVPVSTTATYQWTAPEGITLSDATAEMPTFTAPNVVVDTDYTFSLVVNDGTNDSESSEVIVTVIAFEKLASNYGKSFSVQNNTNDSAWKYYWNKPEGWVIGESEGNVMSGSILDESSYTLLLNAGTMLTADGDVAGNNNAPSTFIRIMPSKGHTGGFVVGNYEYDRYVIAAYTVEEAGSYQIANSTITRPNYANGNGLRMMVIVNNDAPKYHQRVCQTEAGVFDVDLGNLKAGDKIYVAIGADGNGSSDTFVMDYDILVTNQKPEANAGDDQLVAKNTTVTLNGSASTDPENRAITYQWTAPEGITLSDATAVMPTFTAPDVTADEDYVFSLVVSDGERISEADQVIITVTSNPVAYAGADQSAEEQTEVTLDGSGSVAPGGATFTYQWTAPEGVTLSDATAEMPTFTAPDVTVDTDLVFSLVINNGSTDSQEDEVTVTVISNPEANAGQDRYWAKGNTVTLNGSAMTDPKRSAVTYQWTAPAGVTLSDATVANPTFTVGDVAEDVTYIFSLVVNDGNKDSEADEVTITVTPKPSAHAGYDQTARSATTVMLDGSASRGPGGLDISYQWTAPAGVTLYGADTAYPNFSAPIVETETTFVIRLVVTDDIDNSVADEVVITVTPNPVLLSIKDLNLSERLTVYPNPASSQIQLTLDTNLKGEFMLQLMDLTGKLYKKELVQKTEEVFSHELNIEALPKGLYLLQISNGTYFGVKKVQKVN